LARLSEDALALAATQSAGFSLQRRAEDFVAFVVEAVQMLDRGTGRIVVDVPQHPLIVAFDRSRLRHVLDNVVDNALKYSAGPVTVRVAPGESSVRLDVVDRGIGIPAEDLTRIFTRFGRAGNVRARGVAGSGVGLYIAKKIVEVHGGQLSVRSSESEGSTFSISLPLA
jgi:two-component system sensor histidine kinase VicK